MKSWIAAAVMMALPMAARADAAPKAARLWNAKCAMCHGADGKAATDMGTSMAIADMSAPAWQKSFSDAQIKDSITKGVSRTKEGKQQQMQSFASLSAAQVDALVAYIRTLK